jgi:hypothetical protein
MDDFELEVPPVYELAGTASESETGSGQAHQFFLIGINQAGERVCIRVGPARGELLLKSLRAWLKPGPRIVLSRN